MGETPERIRKTVSENIKAARIRAGLTQLELARKLGDPFTSNQISRWERNETTPGYPSIEALADALGLTDAWFYTERGW